MIRIRSQHKFIQQWNECNANIVQIQIIVIIGWLLYATENYFFYFFFDFEKSNLLFDSIQIEDTEFRCNNHDIIVIHLIDRKKKQICVQLAKWIQHPTTIFNGIFLSLTIETMFGINVHEMFGSKTFSNGHKTKSNGNIKIKAGSNWHYS